MNFHEKRRQQFLSERTYQELLRIREETAAYFAIHPFGSGESDLHRHSLARRSVAHDLMEILTVRYTAGEAIEPLRDELERVVVAYERYGELLWQWTKDRNEPVFQFFDLDEYCQLMQIIGLCFLLHRRDLLPRIAALQDGEGGNANGGSDVIYEEFMIHVFGAEKRFATEHACQIRPYENLFYALTEDTPAKQLKELDLFLKRWYKDLAGTGWHDSHKPDENGNQGGYYGYWSFEAGAAVLLLNIEDDSSLHKYLYYPKDLVAWARANSHLADSKSAAESGRVEGGKPCPEDGFWFTPAQSRSRRYFKAGDIMPAASGDYGGTIWQWDTDQEPPKL